LLRVVPGIAAGCVWPPGPAPPFTSGLADRLGALPEEPAPSPRLMLISIAGLETSAYRASGGALEMPTLARLATLGVEAERGAAASPPSAYPGHSPLVTGRTPPP